MKAGITSGFCVPGENDNGRRLIDFSSDRGLCVGNVHFEYKSFIRTQGKNGVEVRNIIYLAIFKKDRLSHVQGMRAVNGMGQGLSDHHFVPWYVW